MFNDEGKAKVKSESQNQNNIQGDNESPLSQIEKENKENASVPDKVAESTPKTSTPEKAKKKYYRRPEHSIFSIHQALQEDEIEEDKIDINTNIDNSLPQDEFTSEDFQEFWTSYMTKIKSKNKPLYNVLDTAKWRITAKKNVELTFDSSVMILEFEKSKEDFIKKVRKRLNNYSISIRTKINKTQKIKNHIKSRREIYDDLVKLNPVIEILRQKLELDIENEPD